MSRSARFLGGLSLGYLNQALITLIGLWITPFLFHRVGQNNYGLWLVAVQILLYMTLMDFGVVALLPREVAYITGRSSGPLTARELPEFIGQNMRLLLWQTPVLIVANLGLWMAMPSQWAPLRTPLALVLIAFTALFPFRIFAALLQGLQDLVFVGKVQMCAAALNLLVAAGLVYAGWGLYALAAAWAVSQGVLAFFCWRRVRRQFPQVLPASLPHLNWRSARRLLGSGSWVTIAQIAQVLLYGTDLVIIAKILGPAAVVPYAFTGKLIMVLANQPQLLMQTAGPALSELRAGESAERQLQACNALSQATLLASGAVACVVMVVNQGFVSWWTGAAQYGGFILCTLLLLNMVLRHWNNPLFFAVFCFGGERRIALTTLFDGLLTVAGSVLLIRRIGPMGAPLAAIAGVCLVSLPTNLSKLALETGQPLWHLIKPLGGWLWRFAPLMAGAIAIERLWIPPNFLSLVAAAIATGAVYTIVMLPAALQPPLGIYLRPRLAALREKFFRVAVYTHA
jgi:O-antigen/teichoic acid export membrane protein